MSRFSNDLTIPNLVGFGAGDVCRSAEIRRVKVAEVEHGEKW
jgi:hypothetical protein